MAEKNESDPVRVTDSIRTYIGRQPGAWMDARKDLPIQKYGWREVFRPKIVQAISGNYVRSGLASDLMAGVIVGIVALPLAIAFAVASGVTPEKGLVTAIVAGFIISLLGGSRVQIGGPTGAFIVIVHGIVAEHGLSGLAVSTMLAGIILIGFGILRLGNVIKFIPHTVIVGFTSGIAVTIFSTQIKDALGLPLESMPERFLPKWRLYLESLGSAGGWSVLIAGGSIGVILACRKLSPRLPGSLIAIVMASAAAWALSLPVDTIGTRFSDIPASLSLSWPEVDFGRLSAYLSPAFTIAMLGAIESLLSAVVADGMIGDEHHSNTELIAQGAANLASPFFGGIPATGAIARTVINVKSGGATPVAGIVHALTLLAITLALGRYAKLIPMSCLAGILILVSYNMSEWRTFLSLLRAPAAEVAVLLATFLLTVLIDLTVAIEIGMILASFIFIQRMADLGTIFRATVRDPVSDMSDGDTGAAARGGSKVDVFEISGPFFFAAAREYQRVLQSLGARARTVVIRMRHVPFVDETGIRSFRDTIRFLLNSRRVVVLSGVREAVRRDLRRYGIIEMLGEERIFPNFTQAMDYINSLPDASASERSTAVSPLGPNRPGG